MVVTGPLPGGYVYWFYEIEAPNGYVQVDSLSFEQRLSEPFVPDGDQVLTDDMENYEAHGGEGIFRYLQFELDKVGVNEDGTGKKPLANATFKVYLSNASGDQLELVASDFTTGVDVPNDTGDYDSSGKAISESIKVHELYDDYLESDPENNPIEQIEVDGQTEYAAYFLLVETEWPANATPKQQEYLMYVTTNGDYDRKTDSERDTIWVAVSYTHLDVYKRQAHRGADRGPRRSSDRDPRPHRDPCGAHRGPRRGTDRSLYRPHR